MKRKTLYTGRRPRKTPAGSGAPRTDDRVPRELQCSRCKAIFPDYLARCPECGSEEWAGLVEVIPYTRMPMETFLKACGHLLWLMGTVGFLVLLWQTDSANEEADSLFMYGAVLLLFCSVLFSAAYFGMSEIMRRILRLQRRLRAFHEKYRETHRDTRRKAADPARARKRALARALEIRRLRSGGRLPTNKMV